MVSEVVGGEEEAKVGDDGGGEEEEEGDQEDAKGKAGQLVHHLPSPPLDLGRRMRPLPAEAEAAAQEEAEERVPPAAARIWVGLQVVVVLAE